MVKVNRSMLLGALGRLSRVSADKDAKVIQFVMNGPEYILTADNRRQRLREIVRVTDRTDGERWTCYPDAKRLFSVIRALDSEEVALSLGSNGGRLEVSGGTSRFTLNVYSREYHDFPPENDTIDGAFCTVTAEALHGTLSRVMHAISDDENRYGINGVHIESLARLGQAGSRMVATNGSRLFYVNIGVGGGVFELAKRTILSRETATIVAGIDLDNIDLDKGGDVQITVSQDGRSVQFDWVKSSIRLITRVLDGEFPDYRQVIDGAGARFGMLEIGTTDLTRALSRVEVMIEDRNRTVKLALYPDQVRLSAVSPKSGDASVVVDAKFEGRENLVVGLNAKYLADAVKNCNTESVQISFGDALAPVLVFGVGTECSLAEALGVVMPVRLD